MKNGGKNKCCVYIFVQYWMDGWMDFPNYMNCFCGSLLSEISLHLKVLVVRSAPGAESSLNKLFMCAIYVLVVSSVMSA